MRNRQEPMVSATISANLSSRVAGDMRRFYAGFRSRKHCYSLYSSVLTQVYISRFCILIVVSIG
ncbi:hypothetical protein [Nostoc sp.]|uniref:hypothetical protein n=1 Tax=Nostoc sp. TaxID=1180 RepID=UPI002FFA9C22